LAELEEVNISYSIPAYPSGGELARALRTYSPQVALLSFEKTETAIAVMRFLETEAHGLPVVALHGAADPIRMRDGMRAGAREFLTPPFKHAQLTEAIRVVHNALRKAPLLPAKPGVGTTTVAINTAAAFAKEPGMKVLLSDLDLTCGMIRFLLKLPLELSIVDALARAAEMDVSLWPQLVSSREGVDILHSGTVNTHAHLEPPQVQGLIDYARANYNALFFDMSGNLEQHSLYVMQESKRVFIVCNPEPASMELGREKVDLLRSLGLGPRIAAIVNRADQALALPVAEVQQFLDVPVVAKISDDTITVHRSIKGGRSVLGEAKQKNSTLAKQYIDFVQALLQAGRSEEPLVPVRNTPAESAVLA
jgi:pilus assembly protein CpaE